MATEIEFKYKLPSAQALSAVEAAASGERLSQVTQVNHFFDTEDFALNRAKLVLRLRQEGERFVLTGKGPAQESADGLLTTKVEEEEEVSAATARALLAGERAALEVLRQSGKAPSRQKLCEAMDRARAGRPLTEVGQFTNVRTKVAHHLRSVGEDVVLECDETTFPGGVTHYEVEVEIGASTDAAAAAKELEALLRRAGATLESAPSKAKRFFAALAGERI